MKFTAKMSSSVNKSELGSTNELCNLNFSILIFREINENKVNYFEKHPKYLHDFFFKKWNRND